ncbi:MAG: hypothetical protein JWL59_837 [Chthoniobacteraceae bacterium]|nr:hypothetical protein [Chthoniobacteraceae bacterium]
MNVILTCAGRRTYAIKAFKDALQGRGKVFACDSNPGAPALQQADGAFIVPDASDHNYIPALLRICRENKIKLLVPALEPELPLFAENRALFLGIGTVPLVSTTEVVDICYDKLRAAQFLIGCGVSVPRTFASLPDARKAIQDCDVQWPLVTKPRWGVSSICLGFPHDAEELELVYALTRRQLERTFLADVSAADPDGCILIQETIKGDEYGLDIVNDLHGRYVCTFAKRKLRMWAGQTDRAITVRDPILEELGRCIGENLGHYGLLDCDVFVSEGRCFVIDMNPRIGGGYPFSHLAGANFPAALVSWMAGENPEQKWFEVKKDFTSSRCDAFFPMADLPIPAPI